MTPNASVALATRSLSSDARARVATRIDAARTLDDTGKEMSGALVVGVVDGGATTFFSTGSLRPGGPPADEHTLFKICSVTKTMTGVLLGDAVVCGRVRLDDDAQKYVRGMTLPRHPLGAIRVAHLATYSAGLPWQPTNFASKLQGGYSKEAWRSFIEGYELKTIPGQRFDYGNVGFALLGDLLAEEAGVPLRDLFQERLWAPLGMSRTGFLGERIGDENRAQGTDADGKLVALDRDEPSQAAACAVETSATDLTKFLRAHFSGSALSRATALALTPQRDGTGPYGQVDAGLGWFIDIESGLASKNGAITGYRSLIAVDRLRERAVAIVAADERVDTSLLLDGLMSDLEGKSRGGTLSLVNAVPMRALPYDVRFDDGLRLVAMDVPAEVTQGETATLRFYYRVETPPRRDWRAFVHVDAKGERVRTHHVFVPALRSLARGALFEDAVPLHFPRGLRAEEFTLHMGLAILNHRMSFVPKTEDNRVVGPKLRVKAPSPSSSSSSSSGPGGATLPSQ